jgi:hypothetical protein
MPKRALRSYLLEAAATAALVGAIVVVILVNHSSDPSLVAEAGLEAEAPVAAGGRASPEGDALDGVWRDDFDDLTGWVRWAGDADVSDDGVLALRAGDSEDAIILQKRPLLFDAADIEMRVASDGGTFSVAVAAAREGPITELTGTRDSSTPADGLALDVDFGHPEGANGQLRWLQDGREMLAVVTQQQPLPTREFTTVNLSVGAQRCEVMLNGQAAGGIQIPWSEGGYRLYLGTRGAESRVDHVALTVPAAGAGPSVGSTDETPKVTTGVPLLLAHVGGALQTWARHCWQACR